MNKNLSIQRFLQTAGVDSRREIRKNIADGMVKINNKIISDPTITVNPQSDFIRYKGNPVYKQFDYQYYILNKPPNVITSLSDPQNRVTIKDLIKSIKVRVFPVGRLDYKSEGLILLTNDGDLMNLIISPKNKIPKTYIVKLSGNISDEKITQLKTKGVFIDNRKVYPLTITKLNNQKDCSVLIKIIEGKKHIVRNIFKFYGHYVQKLKRTSIGTIKLDKLSPGKYKRISKKEIQFLIKKYNLSD